MSSQKILNIASLILTCLALPSVAHSDFQEITRFNLGGDGNWDYLTVDSDSRRIYIARTDRVMVVDADSGKLAGEIKGLNGAHGIAFAPGNEGRVLGFATSGKSGEVFVFDPRTFQVLSKIRAGEKPDAIVYNSASKRVLAFNGNSRNATVIDAETQKVTGTISLAGKPEFAASDDSARVFVNIEDKNLLVELDPIGLKVVAAYPLKPCESPTGLSMDPKSKSLIVGCDNKLAAIVNADSGKVTQTFAVGEGVDATAFESERGLAFISAGEGILTVLSKNSESFQVLSNVRTAEGARTLAVDKKTGRIYLPIAKFKPTDPTSAKSHTHSVLPGTFALLVIGNKP